MTYYSAAAGEMVIRGERCDCGGRLAGREADGAEAAVTTASPAAGNGATAEQAARYKRVTE
jgi:hypothetical protein